MSTLRKEIREKKLKTEKLKGQYRVTLSEFKNYLSSEKFEDFWSNKYLSQERLFDAANVAKEDWKNARLLQSPDWDYVLVLIMNLIILLRGVSFLVI